MEQKGSARYLSLVKTEHIMENEMDAISANDTGMPAMLRHCAKLQTTSLQLCGVIEAIDLLDNEGIGRNAVTCLIGIARSLADEINDQLDSTSLPEGGAA